MPVDDAITLIMRDFNIYKSGGRSVPSNIPVTHDRHPDAIQVLLNMLADNLQLTVLQYDRVIKYLEMRREEQVQLELGEDAKNLGTLVNDPKQAELQSRIMNILNSNKNNSAAPSGNTIAAAAPSPVPPPPVSSGKFVYRIIRSHYFKFQAASQYAIVMICLFKNCAMILTSARKVLMFIQKVV